MSLALYRRYRPGSFAEVIGQEHVTAPLSRAIDSGRIHHAFLFSGPRGCGKTSSARILARSLNCVEGPTSTPCGVCGPCLALGPLAGGGMDWDVVELDAASHNGVDAMRELGERAAIQPRGRFRIFVVDEAHMISKEGFNALLKLVEEPPPHLKFVFATTEPEKVLATIRSRTHHYPFRLVAPALMREHLVKVCAAEGVDVDPGVFPLVVRAGAGSVRDSLSVLDQLIAGAGGERVSVEAAVGLLGVTPVALLDDVVDALTQGDGASLLGAVDRMAGAGLDPRRFTADLLDRVRDLIVVRAVPGAVESGLVDASADEAERMAEQASRLGPGELTRFGEVLHAGLTEMRGSTSPRLLLEIVLSRLLLPAAHGSEASLLARIERLERSGPPIAGAAPPMESAVDHVPSAVPTGHDRAGTTEHKSAALAAARRARERSGSTDDARSGQSAGTSTAAPVSGASSSGTHDGGAAPSGAGATSTRPRPPQAADRSPSPAVAAGRTPAVESAHPMPAGAAPGRREALAVWDDVLSDVQQVRKAVAVLLRQAEIADLAGGALTLRFATPGLRHTFESGVGPGLVAAAVLARLGAEVQVKGVVGDTDPGDRPAPTRSSAGQRLSSPPEPVSEPPAPAVRGRGAAPQPAEATVSDWRPSRRSPSARPESSGRDDSGARVSAPTDVPPGAARGGGGSRASTDSDRRGAATQRTAPAPASASEGPWRTTSPAAGHPTGAARTAPVGASDEAASAGPIPARGAVPRLTTQRDVVEAAVPEAQRANEFDDAADLEATSQVVDAPALTGDEASLDLLRAARLAPEVIRRGDRQA